MPLGVARVWKMPARTCLALALVTAGMLGLEARASVDLGDAYIRESAGGHEWRIGNAEIEAAVVVTKIGVRLESLARHGRASVVVPQFGDTTFAYDAVRSTLGDRTYRYLRADTSAQDGRVVLTMTFALRDRPLTVHRSYAVTPGVPALETWTTVEAGSTTTVRDPDALALTFAARDLTWQRGLEVPDEQGGPFERRTARLTEGGTVEFGSDVLSSRQHLPWFSLSGAGERVTVGLGWSGTWRATVRGTDAGALVALGVPGAGVAVTPGRPLELPRAFLVVTADTAGDQARALTAWTAARRGGRAYPSLITYNTWFPFGIQIDDALVRRQMEAFADVGGELFELDAGWYPPRGASGRFDFTAGLGSWQVDRRRFPDGIGALSTYAHALGLKFGVWVEPERVDPGTVGAPGGALERYLARQDGRYQPGRDNAQAEWAQICLAHDEAWTWVRDRLVTFLQEARADYVKIDLNGWAVCTREDHDHGRDGGNFGHVHGLYRLLAALRERFPTLLIENVSGGARRLDPVLLALTDASWLDDRSAPSARVRHHLSLLTTLAPPSALLSYVMAGEGEPLVGAPDYPWLVRSRMLGVVGLAVDFRDLRDTDSDRLRHNLAEHRVLRDRSRGAFATPLTEPVRVDGGGPGWDVVQHTQPTTGRAALYAFRNPAGARRVRVTPAHLRAGTRYRAWSFESGTLEVASAEELMQRGLEIEAVGSAAQVVLLDPQ